MLTIELFTDGSSYLKDGVKASSAAYAIYVRDKLIKQGGGFFNNGTNNLAESSAVLLGLNRISKLIRKLDNKFIQPPIKIKVYTDSYITCQTCREWIYIWLKKSKDGVLTNSSGGKVANQEVFKEIHSNFLINDMYHIQFFHINSHTIEHAVCRDNMEEIKKYFVKRHTKKNITLCVPDSIFKLDKFRSAKATFKKKNGSGISDMELLRLLSYNRDVDILAKEYLVSGLKDLGIKI